MASLLQKNLMCIKTEPYRMKMKIVIMKEMEKCGNLTKKG